MYGIRNVATHKFVKLNLANNSAVGWTDEPVGIESFYEATKISVRLGDNLSPSNKAAGELLEVIKL